MEKRIGEVFKYNGVTLITIENNSCEGCFFNNKDICTIGNRLLLCSSIFREDNKNVIFRDDNKNVTFKEVKDMESRTIKLTLEKAKEFYKKGGEFKDLALSAFTEEELTKVELPKTWEEFCSQFKIHGEYYIDTDSSINGDCSGRRSPIFDKNMLPSKEVAEQHLALMQLHQLRDCYRQSWEPNWLDDDNKYCIVYNSVYNYFISINKNTRVFLSFQSREIAQLFLDNFRNLIKEAGDLI